MNLVGHMTRLRERVNAAQPEAYVVVPLESFAVLGPCLGDFLDDAVVEVSLALHFHPRVWASSLHDQAVARRGRVGRCLLGPASGGPCRGGGGGGGGGAP